MGDSASTVRLFVAVDLDETARWAVTRAAGDLAERIVASGSSDRITWVRPHNLHLTLRFLGDVETRCATEVRNRLSPSIATPSFDLELAGTGAFPAAGSPRVVWLAVKDPRAGLARLVDEIDARLKSAGLRGDSRPFAAHVTVGRVRRATGGGRAIRRAIEQVRVEPVRWQVNRLTLYESRLSSTGPAYAPVIRTPVSASEQHERKAPDTAG